MTAKKCTKCKRAIGNKKVDGKSICPRCAAKPDTQKKSSSSKKK